MEQITSILADLLDTNETNITIESAQDDFETWDSIAIINLAVALENEYSITLAAEDVEALTSVRSIVAVLKKKGVENLV